MSIEEICKQYEFTGLILFGSGVQDLQKAGDIDLCFFRDRPLDLKEWWTIPGLFSDLYHKDKIDLVWWHKAPSLLRYNIFKNHQVLYGNETQIENLLMVTPRMWWDDNYFLFQPFKNRNRNAQI